MFLSMVAPNETCVVQQILGREKQQQHLLNIGLVPGATVRVISSIGQGLIVLVKDSRLAISRDLAQKVVVSLNA